MRVLVVSLLAAAMLSASITDVLFWYEHRVEMHRQWGLEVDQAFWLKLHLGKVGQLLGSNVQSDPNYLRLNWFNEETVYVYMCIQVLRSLDVNHELWLSSIGGMALVLNERQSYLLSLNLTSRSDLAQPLYTVADNLRARQKKTECASTA
jgi:hypothetical protein